MENRESGGVLRPVQVNKFSLQNVRELGALPRTVCHFHEVLRIWPSSVILLISFHRPLQSAVLCVQWQFKLNYINTIFSRGKFIGFLNAAFILWDVHQINRINLLEIHHSFYSSCLSNCNRIVSVRARDFSLLLKVQTNYEAHPASYVPWFFPGGKGTGAWSWQLRSYQASATM